MWAKIFLSAEFSFLTYDPNPAQNLAMGVPVINSRRSQAGHISNSDSYLYESVDTFGMVAWINPCNTLIFLRLLEDNFE